MRQRTLRLTFFMLAMLVFTGLVVAQPRPASAVPASRLGVLSGLAAYVPNDALFFASARTDTEAIAAIQALLGDIAEGVPGVFPPPPVEDLIGDMLGVPFDDLRPWLGEGVAIAGLPKATVDQWSAWYDYFAVVQAADPAAAEAFLTSRMGAEKVLALNDVLLLGEPHVLARFEAGAPMLLNEPAFTTAIESFESRNYAGLVYADLPLLIAKQRGEDLRRYRETYYYNGEQRAVEAAMLLRMFGPVAIGVTRATDGELMMDVVVTAGNLNGIRPLGLNLQPPQPADPALLAVVPDDAFMVTQGSNLSGGLVELYRVFGPLLKDAWAESLIHSAYQYGYTSPAPYELLQDMDVFTLADLILGNALGVTMSDLQNWSSDDYIVFSRLNPNWPPQDDSLYVMPVETAGVFRVARPEQSFAAFENLARTLQLWAAGSGEEHIDVRIERQESQRAVFVTFYLDGREKPGTTIALYVTGEYAILGARGAAEAALARLDTTETAAWLAEAAANFQPDSAFNGVFDPSAFVPALAALTGMRNAEDITPYLAKLETLAFDLLVASNGATVMRFTIGLSDAGEMETALGIPTLVPPPPQIIPTIHVLAIPPAIPTLAPPPESTVEVDPIILEMTATAAAPLPEATLETIPETAMLTATWDAAFTQTAAFVPTLPPTWTPTSISPTLEFPTEPVISELWNLPAFRGEDGAFVLGDPSASTTLVVFSDWACPHCQNLAPVIDAFIASDVAGGAVNLEHRTLITAGGDATRWAARLAECIDNQKPGAFWSAFPVLYGIAMESPDVYNDAFILGDALSAVLNLDTSLLTGCSRFAEQITTDERYAAEIGANYTPFVAVRNADGTLTVVTDRTLEGIREAVYGGQNAMPLEMTPTFTPDTAEATRAAELANAAATQAAAGQPTATP